MSGAPPLLNKSTTAQVSAASVAKRRLLPGETIARGCGGFDLQGICVRMVEHPGHVPICRAVDLHVRRRVEPGQILTMDVVELSETEALSTWQAIERRALKSRQARAS
jgi:predicted homoserine dehydrogenase-like protein